MVSDPTTTTAELGTGTADNSKNYGVSIRKVTGPRR